MRGLCAHHEPDPLLSVVLYNPTVSLEILKMQSVFNAMFLASPQSTAPNRKSARVKRAGVCTH